MIQNISYIAKRRHVLVWLFNRHLNSPPSPNFQYCTELVQKRDYESYLCLLLLPVETRTIGMVTRAFNVELSQIVDATTEMHTAKMRLEFWKKGVNDTFEGHPPNHPVLISMALTLEQKMLSKHFFKKLIDIRERHLHQKPFMSLNDVQEYGEYSVSPIFNLLLEAIDANETTDALMAADQIGKASSLITLIRSAPYYISNRKVLLPTELCVKHSVSQEDVLRHVNEDGVREIMVDIAGQANIHLQQVMTLKQNLKKTVRRLFLPTVPYELFLKHLQHIGFNIYDPKLNEKQPMLPLKLLLASWRK